MESNQNQEDEYINSNSKLGKLILRVDQMHKKPLLDNSLSQILDVFLQKLSQSEDFLVNGIFQINFAEAALLLQSSAFVYSKKVDLLWDSVNQYQKRMISFNSDENKKELKRLEEREQKYRRKRKVVEVVHKEKNRNKIENFNIDWNDVNELQHLNCERDSRLFSGWYKKMVVNWDLQPTSIESKTFAEKYSHFRSSNNAILDKDNDEEFVVYTSKMESAMRLEELFLQPKSIFGQFSFELYTELYLVPNFLEYHQLKFDDMEKYTEKFEKIVSCYKDRLFVTNNSPNISIKSSSPESRQMPQKLRRISITSTVISKLSRLDFDKIYSQECQVNLLRLSVDDLSRLCRLSVDEVRKCSEPPHDIPDSNIENFQETCSSDKIITNEDISCIPNVIDEGSDTNLLSANEVSNLSDNHDDNVHDNEDFPSSTVINSVPDLTVNSSDIENPEVSEILQDSDTNLVQNTLMVTQKQCIVSNRTHEVVKRMKCFEDNVKMVDEDHIPLKRRRLSKAALKKLATGITVDLKEFSVFFAIHYNPEEGEGQVEIPEFDIDDPVYSSSRIDPNEDLPLSQLIDREICTQDSGLPNYSSSRIDLDEDLPLSQLIDRGICTQDSGFESRINEEDDADLPIHSVQGVSNEACTSSEERELATNDPADRPFEMTSLLPGDEKPLHERVYEWKQYMSEKFKKMKSADFDIHEYGSNIMRNLDPERPKKFGEIVRGKSSAEVTRFFISALQLANTCNVEIEGALSGRLSNDTFSLKLITRDRYYDRLKSYMAPSEETYRERLESAKKSKKRRDFPTSSCGRKRSKV